MSSFYVVNGSPGIKTYPSLSAFPPISKDGTCALALDNDVLYAYDATTADWVDIASPGGSVAYPLLPPTSAAPQYSFTADTDTGFGSTGAGLLFLKNNNTVTFNTSATLAEFNIPTAITNLKVGGTPGITANLFEVDEGVLTVDLVGGVSVGGTGFFYVFADQGCYFQPEGLTSMGVLCTLPALNSNDNLVAQHSGLGVSLVVTKESGALSGLTATISNFEATNADPLLLLRHLNSLAPTISLKNAAGTDAIGILVPALTDTYNITLPDEQGAPGSVLTNDGLGNLSWEVP